MSNPFDQFAVDFKSALPNDAVNHGPPPFGAPSTAPPPPMNSPPPMMQPGYGAPPPNAGSPPPYTQSPQPVYGMPPQQTSPQPSYGVGGGGNLQPNYYGQAPSSTNPYGAPPPQSEAFGNGYDGGAMAPGRQVSVQSSVTGHSAENGGGGGTAADANNNPFASFGGVNGEAYDHKQPDNVAVAADPWGAPPQESTQQHSYGDANGYGAPAPPPPPPFDPQQYGAPPDQNNPYGAPPPAQHQPEQNPYGPPAGDGGNPYGMPPPQQQHPPNPYGAPPPGNNDPNFGAMVPSEYQSNPYAGYGAPPPPPQHAYGMPPQQQMAPYGYGGYQQPPPPPPVDPFSVFEQQQLAKVEPQQQAIVPAENAVVPAGPDPAAPDDDFWGAFSTNAPDEAAEQSEDKATSNKERGVEEEKKDEGLPSGGEYYDARIFTPTLGVMFFKPQELTDSLFLNTDKDLVDALADRPVVAFIVEGSSARAAGVELGHVLLKVNGQDVRSPKEASRFIKEGPRPLPLLFYVPNTDVVTAEGEHMVKYDTRETTAPSSAKEWKPKYVVIGGIIAQPWMINMYRSKSEYDIAVIETQARRPVSVKVKQFSMQGARIQNDWQGPQMVKYKNKLHPWKYIVVLPVARNPIKISSPNLASLKPVHEGIRRVLNAQQRGPGSRDMVPRDYRHSQPEGGYRREDSYRGEGGGGGGGGGGDYDRSPPRNQHGTQPQGGYAQPAYRY